eukprot:RCo008315
MEENSVSGIIYPPPEVKTIVDKTAQFVARNGKEFEARIRVHEKDNPKFKFLLKENPYNAYYEMKLEDFKRKEDVDAAARKEPPKEGAVAPQPEPVQGTAKAEGMVVDDGQFSQAQIVPSRQARPVPKENPCPSVFTIAVPVEVAPLDLDVIRLTAQYVARHGQSFLSNVTAREQKNPQFDFLKGTHRHFQFFRSLVDAYTKILLPSKDMLEVLRQEMENKLTILDRCMSASEWQKVQEAKRKAAEEEEDKQRVAFQLIDWHEFVVVETIDFKDEPEDEASLPAPPPTSSVPVPHSKAEVTPASRPIPPPVAPVRVELPPPPQPQPQPDS